MYHMEERDSIILAYRRDGLSIREIARRNGMSRKTVRKYLRAFEQAVGDNPDAEAMDTYLQQPVRYDSSKRVRRVMNQQVMEAIDGFMAPTGLMPRPDCASSRCARLTCGAGCAIKA